MAIGFRVFTEVNRPSEELVSRFREKRSCDLSDVMNRSQTMTGIAPIYRPVPRVVGPAITASLPAGGINMLKVGMEQTRSGDVFVVNSQGYDALAMWGGNVSRGMKARGVCATIIDGMARDKTEIAETDYPVFARGIAVASAPAVEARGEINVPIACGGVVVNPGDIVVADEDGIVVIPPTEAEDVLQRVGELETLFESLQPTLLAGKVTNIENVISEARAQGCVFE